MTSTSTSQSAPGRDLLLRVARRLFLERGYAQVSIQQIAEESNMTKGAPYYYFSNKQDLFINVCLDIMADLKQLLEKSLSGEGSFQERIERATVDVVRTIAGDFSQWYSDLLRLDDKKAIGKSMKAAYGADDLNKIFLSQFERAVESGDIGRVRADVAARAYFLLLKGTIDDCSHQAIRFPDSEIDIESNVHQLVDIYFNGIR